MRSFFDNPIDSVLSLILLLFYLNLKKYKMFSKIISTLRIYFHIQNRDKSTKQKINIKSKYHYFGCVHRW